MWIKTSCFAIFVLLLSVPITLFSQKATLSGFIRESGSNEVIVGAKVYSSELNKGATTNASGYFSLTLPNAEYQITIDAFGHQKQQLDIKLFKDTVINFYLSLDRLQELDEVNIVSSKNEPFGEPRLGLIDVPIEQLKNIPNLAGEPDIIKAYQLMPGVQSGSEGTSGLYVRGGTPDQNLFLLDNTVLNAKTWTLFSN